MDSSLKKELDSYLPLISCPPLWRRVLATKDGDELFLTKIPRLKNILGRRGTHWVLTLNWQNQEERTLSALLLLPDHKQKHTDSACGGFPLGVLGE